jgi:hypothetical protein
MRIRVLAVLAAIVLSASPAFAARGGARSLDWILSHLRSERGGTFYDAQGPFVDANGNMHYRIKWLTPQGQLIWLDTDARTGRVLGVDRGEYREMPQGRHDRFDNSPGGPGPYDYAPRENFPRDQRWPRWEGGAPVGGGDWHDRGGGNGRWRRGDDEGHRGHH